MNGGAITNNDFGIRLVCSQGANQEYTKNSKVYLNAGLIKESSRHQFQAAGAPGLDFVKLSTMIIRADGTARIQIRDMTATDIADYRGDFGDDVPLSLKIQMSDPHIPLLDGNRYIEGSDTKENGKTTWRLLKPQQ
jgi:hypothetical protein